ncbi:hypothetical protein KAZ82_01520 [Candidatus Babeliales bacterium]|nr:hypothetical protein [Candidatus Babeliales bacterium]
MKKIALAIIVIICAGYWFTYKFSKQNLHVILSEKTVFFIDPELSKALHCKISEAIEVSYAQSKNPEQVIADSSIKFPEIESMKVQICQSDKICFYVQASKPLFLLNHNKVVCENGSIVDGDHFDDTVVRSLVSVFTKNSYQVQEIINFVQALPEIFKQNFSIEFRDLHDIVLTEKNNKNFCVQANIQAVPTVQDLQACKKIVQEVALQPKFKKKSITCDVRFKKQIIVR